MTSKVNKAAEGLQMSSAFDINNMHRAQSALIIQEEDIASASRNATVPISKSALGFEAN